MCGIAGLMTRDGSPPADAVLDRLASALVHRGPDGEGRYVNGGMGLVHRRLRLKLWWLRSNGITASCIGGPD